jgi:hypothetical protein
VAHSHSLPPRRLRQENHKFEADLGYIRGPWERKEGGRKKRRKKRKGERKETK